MSAISLASFSLTFSLTATGAESTNFLARASFTIIASEDAVKKYDLEVLAEIVNIGQGGVDPNFMGMGPVPAIRHLLNNADMTLKDVDLIELNEAFASQSLGVLHELEVEHGVKREDILKYTNVNGGAIALGHPVGVSGNRIVVTLIHEMIKRNAKTGLASLCIGGGMGTAILIKR